MLLICDFRRNQMLSTKEIAEKVNINPTTVSHTLRICADMGLCEYDGEKEKLKGWENAGKKASKIVLCLNNNMVFDSAEECSRRSLEVLGIHMESRYITRVCRKERKSYKGFKFKYLEKEG